MRKCAHCGKEVEYVTDGLCPECSKSCDDAIKLLDYKATILGFIYVAVKALLGITNGQMTFGEAVCETVGTIIAAQILCAIAALFVKPLYAKSKRYLIIVSIVAIAIISSVLYARSLNDKPRVSYDEYQQLLDEYNELCKDSTYVSDQYDDLLQDLSNLSDEVEDEEYYGYDEIADELDEIVYNHE